MAVVVVELYDKFMVWIKVVLLLFAVMVMVLTPCDSILALCSNRLYSILLVSAIRLVRLNLQNLQYTFQNSSIIVFSAAKMFSSQSHFGAM